MTPLEINWLGQSGFIFRFPHGATICIDPYLSYATSAGKTRERLTPIPIPATDLIADVVVTTHDHSDHFDEHSLRPISERRGTLFVGPSSCRDHWQAMELPAERFLMLDQGQSLEIANVRFTAIFAAHDSGSKRDAIGVIIEAGGYKLYHGGDSEYVPELIAQARDLRPDVLMVPINGRLGNMDHTQAAQLTQLVQPRVVIPMHYGMFRHNTADPQDFITACRQLALATRIVLMQTRQPFTLEPRTGDNS